VNQTYSYVRSIGTITCKMPSGLDVTLPIVPGILKHPTPEMLPSLLVKPEVAWKYTTEALRKASWPVLRLFPKAWLLHCLPEARLSEGRTAALNFLLR